MKKPTIGILTFPISEAGNTPLSNLVDIIYPLSNELYLITGNDGYAFFKDDDRVHAYEVRHTGGLNIVTRIITYVCTQLRISVTLAKIAGKIDTWFFFIGGEGLLLPMLTTRLLGGRVILLLAGFPTKGSQVQKDPTSKPTDFLSKINLILSNRIVVYSESIIKERGLEKYRNKISIAKRHFLDFDKFKVKKKFVERKNNIGYIGNLHKIKGTLNFVRAIPQILEKENEIEFVIGGDGVLFDEIEKFIGENKLNDKVKLTGWISHNKLPDYLNELKLVVLPSYTEGLPNVMLEAMACGTPVLATPVGGVPDIIKDGETGFILEDNSPEHIAKNVIRALKHPDLEEIVKSAGELVGGEFTYEGAVGRYKRILEQM